MRGGHPRTASAEYPPHSREESLAALWQAVAYLGSLLDDLAEAVLDFGVERIELLLDGLLAL